jgi:hypothetical protein
VLGYLPSTVLSVALLDFSPNLPVSSCWRIACCQLAGAAAPLLADASCEDSHKFCSLPPSSSLNLNPYNRWPEVPLMRLLAACNVPWVAIPVPPHPCALCGPYSSIYAGVEPRTRSHTWPRSFSPAARPRVARSLTVPAAPTQAPITTRRNFCMCVKATGLLSACNPSC